MDVRKVMIVPEVEVLQTLTRIKYTRSNTPAKSSVSVPASLSAGGANRTANAGSSNGIFYSELKMGVEQMKMSVSNADLNLIMIDARYDDTEMGTC